MARGGTASTLDSQLAIFEGREYPDAEVKLAGGITGSSETLLPEVTGLRIGDTFELTVRGEVIGKSYKLKRDAEGIETRVMTIALKVDTIEPA